MKKRNQIRRSVFRQADFAPEVWALALSLLDYIPAFSYFPSEIDQEDDFLLIWRMSFLLEKLQGEGFNIFDDVMDTIDALSMKLAEYYKKLFVTL